MRRVRGIHDIKTHGTLAREGRLVSVARDLHQINRKGVSPEEGSWDGKIKPISLKRTIGTRKPNLALERSIRAIQITIAQELIAEMEEFVEEGLPGALVELNRLKTKLSRLKGV